MTKPVDVDAAKAKAEALFKRQQLLDAADENRRAAEAAKLAEAEKTARLRALRLAREQSGQIAAQGSRARREKRRP
jgi:hypothetical protein